MEVSPLKQKLGVIPIFRLRDARKMRDKLRASLLREGESPSKIVVTLVVDGFGVQVYHDAPERPNSTSLVDGVLIKVSPAPIKRPRR